MVFANNNWFNKSSELFTIISLSTFLVSCAAPERLIVIPRIEDIQLEPKSSLLLWHDITHKSYFGLKGAVKRLVVMPANLVGDADQLVSDEWEYLFNKNGRVTSKSGLGDGVDIKTLFSYSDQGDLTHIASYRDGEPWRSSKFSYQDGQLVKINFSDNSSQEQSTVKVSRQIVSNGWFEIQKLITSPGLPAYSQFLNDDTLVWSNKGDINNGLGELYYLRTVDSVTSSSIANKDTLQMQGRGGYRYLYNQNGLLKAVESFNAHANRLFHRTRYEYNELGLLVSETREVKDTSPFNQVSNESVIYQYQRVDEHGNWTERKLTAKSGFQTQVFTESRKIEYY